MKKYQRLPAFVAFLVVVFAGYGFHNASNHTKPVADSSKGFAIIELFTSEGCSSCPSAEVLSGIISNENNKDVHILSFHVDYWNQYGWKDIFSSNAYTVRQQEYAGFFKLKSIYTPQVVVNGKTEFVGSDERKLRSAIKQELNNTSVVAINLQASVADKRSISVTCSVRDATNSILNIALVQKYAETAVKRGENAGKFLKHVDIVRGFKKLAIVDGTPNLATLYIPEGVAVKDLKVVAYVQNKDDFKVSGVSEKVFN
jgi:hypothetical protein